MFRFKLNVGLKCSFQKTRSMHCNSKLFNVNQKIKFLERNLFENSQLINELTTNFCKLKLSPTKQKRRQNTFQDHIKRNKGEELFDFFKHCYYH